MTKKFQWEVSQIANKECSLAPLYRWFKCKLKPPKKQEDEILIHLAKLTRDKRNDTVRLPAGVPEAKQVLDPSHQWYKYDDNARYGSRARSSSCASSVAFPEVMEQDPMQASAPESTNTEMYQVVERDLLITNDYDPGWVRGAARVCNQAAGGTEQSGDV